MKKRVLTILFLLIAFPAILYCSRDIDSLSNLLKSAKDKERVGILKKLSYCYFNVSLDKALEYGTEALELATINNDTALILDAFDIIGIVYFRKGNFDKSLDCYNKGYSYAVKVQRNVNSKRSIAYFLTNLGVVNKNLGKYQQAIEYYQKAMQIQEEIGDTIHTAYTVANIGNIYYYFGLDYDKALDNYTRALVLFEQCKKKSSMANILNNIGLVYKIKKDYAKALENYRRSLKISQEINVKPSEAQAQTGIGSVYLEGGNYEMALKFSLDALAVYKKIGDNVNTAYVSRDIGNVYYRWGNYSNALMYYKQSSDLFKQMKMKKEVLDNYKDISNVYSLMGDYKSAYNNFTQYSVLKDSVLGEDYLKQIHEMEARYESDKKDGEIKLQKADLDKKDIEAKRKNIFLAAVGLIALLVIGFSFMLYKQYSEKKKANILLAEQNDEIKLQRDQIFQQKKEITDSIHYASRIQRAVLPPDKLLTENNFEHFILYKPRDIVSGDFYWMNQRDDKLIIAAADCTGHGVPGAFMSMLGMAFLNEIFSKGEFDNAAQILNQLRQHVVNSMHQTGKSEETKDGMDISLCLFEKESNRVHFAGAFNSLYVVRNGELIEADADRMPIGFHDKMSVPFTNHILEIQKSDTIYILSDGYIDQFGGESGKKFMAKRFKQLLLSLEPYAMEKQREILDTTITEWRGDLDQVDDIMVIGIRV